MSVFVSTHKAFSKKGKLANWFTVQEQHRCEDGHGNFTGQYSYLDRVDLMIDQYGRVFTRGKNGLPDKYVGCGAH